MRVETFYHIANDIGKIEAGKYAQVEYEIAKKKLVEIARANPGKTYHLMKRVTSVTANDLIWEDFE